MRSFSAIALIATLALSTFTSAAPSPAISETVVDIGARTASCPGPQCILNTMHDQVKGHADQIKLVKVINQPNAQVLVGHLTAIKTIVGTVHASIKQDCTQLTGLGGADVCAILALLLNLIAEIVLLVLGLLSGLSSTDPFCILLNPCIQDLLCEVAGLVNTVLCLVCGLLGGLLGAGGLLGGLIGLLGGILGPVLALVLQIVLPILAPLLVQLSGALTPGCGSVFNLFPVAGATLLKGILRVSSASVEPETYINSLLGSISL
ncbi:hypothetical protein C8J56DRAFT_888338 [Mycena floridula]|nr:hypothetical protein C8J56DRAFT_888338 [Mycena floridula]